MPLSEVMRDASALGGLAAYLAVVGAVAVFSVSNPSEYNPLLLQLILGLIVLYAFVSVIRLMYFKERPVTEPHSSFFERIDASAFPSMHSARAMLLAILFSNAQMPWSFLVFLVPLSVGITRVYLKRHDWKDVVGGWVVGVVIGASTLYLPNVFS